MSPLSRLARALALATILLTAAPASLPAVTLAPGDLLMLAGQPWTATWTLLRVDRATGVPRDTVSTGGALLTEPQGLVAVPDGSVLVADRLAGLVRIDAATGSQSVFVPASAFGGGQPIGVAREATGNLVVVCGDASGIWRVSPAGVVLGAFSPHGSITYANAIAVAPDGGLWLADGIGQVVRVDPVTGAQVPLAVSGVSWATPIGIALGPDAATIYVMMLGAFFYHHLAGTYAIDRASGLGALVPNAVSWVQGVAADGATGEAWVSSIDVINHDTPYESVFSKGMGVAFNRVNPGGQHFSGLLALVPPATSTATLPTTWGRVKAMMR